jgi:hypothetical protein
MDSLAKRQEIKRQELRRELRRQVIQQQNMKQERMQQEQWIRKKARQRMIRKRKRRVLCRRFLVLCTTSLAIVILFTVLDRFFHLGIWDYNMDKTKLFATGESMRSIDQDIKKYPVKLQELYKRNKETLAFVKDYPNRIEDNRNIDLSGDYEKGKIPLLLQWDTRWGYCKYGQEIIAINGCGPTCMSMVVVGLTGDLTANPYEMAKYCESKGWCTPQGSDWAMMTQCCTKFGIRARELALWKDTMVQELQADHPIICCMSAGEFTQTGHFIVLYDYDGKDFLLHDPNSKIRSGKNWSYEELKTQIKNMWVYSIND